MLFVYLFILLYSGEDKQQTFFKHKHSACRMLDKQVLQTFCKVIYSELRKKDYLLCSLIFLCLIVSKVLLSQFPSYYFCCMRVESTLPRLRWMNVEYMNTNLSRTNWEELSKQEYAAKFSPTTRWMKFCWIEWCVGENVRRMTKSKQNIIFKSASLWSVANFLTII